MSPRRRIIPIFVPHAGCPNMCVFCDQKRISGSLFPADAAAVERSLSPLSDGAGYELAFYGDGRADGGLHGLFGVPEALFVDHHLKGA